MVQIDLPPSLKNALKANIKESNEKTNRDKLRKISCAANHGDTIEYHRQELNITE